MKIVVDKDEYEELKKYKRKYSIAKKRIEELKETNSDLEEHIEWLEGLAYKEQTRRRELQLKELCEVLGCTKNELIEETKRRFPAASTHIFRKAALSRDILTRTKALDRKMQILRYCAKQLENRV